MRYRPEAVCAGDPVGRRGRRGLGARIVRMQVVYSPAHLGHDITLETFMGMPVPANEVAERAERIRVALEADGGFAARRADRAR